MKKLLNAKQLLQNEINELEVRIAVEESRAPPAAQRCRKMEGEVPDTGAGVGAFVSPSKKKVSFVGFLPSFPCSGSQDLLKLSEQCSAHAKDRDSDLGMDEPALPATEEDDVQGTQLG